MPHSYLENRMSPPPGPLVSVVTPVRNGEKYLAQCIESVLAQTYQNWEYIIVNNCSTDRSLQIASAYAGKDSRIRVHDNEKPLNMIPNWNHALRQISEKSSYCKVVHADDWLFPECLERMVQVAEEHPTVGIVESYVLKGVNVAVGGLPYPSTFVPGREICRAVLSRKEFFSFGSPSSLLIRSDIVRQRHSFYDESFLHADAEACYHILQTSDFGFVHQVLSFTRVHNDSQTETLSEKYNIYFLEYLGMLRRYGPVYFSPEEYRILQKKMLNIYYYYLARNLFRFKDRTFRDHHRNGIRRMDIPVSKAKVAYTFLSLVMDNLLNPKRTAEKLGRHLMDRMANGKS